MLRAFDGPDALGPLPSRATTTVAPQALFLMNDRAVRGCAEHLATTLLSEASEEQLLIVEAWRRVLGRAPEPQEAEAAREFLRAQEGAPRGRAAALADLCQALLATNEFAYVD